VWRSSPNCRSRRRLQLRCSAAILAGLLVVHPTPDAVRRPGQAWPCRRLVGTVEQALRLQAPRGPLPLAGQAQPPSIPVSRGPPSLAQAQEQEAATTMFQGKEMSLVKKTR
jgi:hypothetical protein